VSPLVVPGELIAAQLIGRRALAACRKARSRNALLSGSVDVVTRTLNIRNLVRSPDFSSLGGAERLRC
jgi:hypothetical protein